MLPETLFDRHSGKSAIAGQVSVYVHLPCSSPSSSSAMVLGQLCLRIPAATPPACGPPLQGGAGIRGMGVSLVDALSTLKVMGLDQQFKE